MLSFYILNLQPKKEIQKTIKPGRVCHWWKAKSLAWTEPNRKNKLIILLTEFHVNITGSADDDSKETFSV